MSEDAGDGVIRMDLSRGRSIPSLAVIPDWTRTNVRILGASGRNSDTGENSAPPRIVHVTVGPGETHIQVTESEGVMHDAWTALFGWGSLCHCRISHEGGDTHLMTEDLVSRAVRGNLRIYGSHVDTGDMIAAATDLFRSTLSDILDRTIGDGVEYDQIILCGPEWLHGILDDCRKIRPHITGNILNT